MVKIYTHKDELQEDEMYVSSQKGYDIFYKKAFDNVDFEKYDEVFQNTMDRICFTPYALKVDYKNKRITTSLGTCSFNCLGSGMKLFFAYIYLGEKYQRENYNGNKFIIDFTNCGNNVLQYVFKYANIYKIPIYCRSRTFIINKCDYEFMFNNQGPYDYLELCGEYYSDVFGIDDEDYQKILRGD